MAFKKGQSGNPVGRASAANIVHDEIDKVLFGRGKNKRALIHDIIERWARIAAHAEKDSDALAAADKLLTRRIGAPTQHVEGHMTSEQTVTHVFVAALREHAARLSNNVACITENRETPLLIEAEAVKDEQDQCVTGTSSSA